MRTKILSAVLLGVGFHLHAQIDGAPTGWWTDADGNNHYGPVPSDSYDSSSSYGYSGYSGSSSGGGYGGSSYDWSSAFDSAAKDFEKGMSDWQAEFKKRQDRQRAEREKQRELLRRKLEDATRRPGSTSSGTGAGRPTFNLFNLDNTGRNWSPGIVDLKPRAVASQIRSGDNYARKKQWDQAIRQYQAALRVDPKSTLAKQKLAEAQKAKKNAPPKKGLFSRN